MLPWTLYIATGDASVLRAQHDSMTLWLKHLPRDVINGTRLWDPNRGHFGNWLDPYAPPSQPWEAKTAGDSVANAFLIYDLQLMTQISLLLGHEDDSRHFWEEHKLCRQAFTHEFVTETGRLVSESQTAYTLAIIFNLFDNQAHLNKAGMRLAQLVVDNDYCIGTGFVGIPYIREALSRTGQGTVALRMILNQKCPSWLYQVKAGAITIWERWDSMTTNGKINEGKMASFNHYASGSIATYLHERVAGLKNVEAGWRRSRCEPDPAFWTVLESAPISHVGPFGPVACGWHVKSYVVAEQEKMVIEVSVSVPPLTTMKVKLPGEDVKIVGSGKWTYEISLAESLSTEPPGLSF